eukprot:TRINITY_DN4927_c0_g1_i6.p1 TRINITY_DN4927_c0_g1~~TRINITY_DN4927_c0_g1_i6.p1  ORF type:complete len:712 (-),score=116.81 TRINITY_DN4927_c0_g1_i6:41-2176(-)
MNRSRKLVAWALYFPTEEEDIPNDPRVALCHAFEDYFQRQSDAYPEEDVLRTSALWIDHSILRGDLLLINRFAPVFDANPMEALDCICIGYLQKTGLVKPFDKKKIHARLYNHEPITPLKNLKSNNIGKFISIKGTVIRVSIIKPLIQSVDFICTKCNVKCTRVFKDGKYVLPEQCPMGGCKSTNFFPERTSATSVDWQKIKIQEILGDDQREAGRMPRNIECELTEDLVDSCVPGDMVTVSGIVKVVSTDGDSGRSKTRSLFLLYIDAVSVVNSKQVEEGKMELLQFSTKDLHGIREIAHDPNSFRLVVNSVCPSIFGHELVKAGLVLSLFGGVQKSGGEKNKISTRGDIHVLVVGDPGLGKSQMLQAVSNLAPRGVYVCGNTTTGAGLTVTVLKDPISGDFALEAGALVLGDQGCCCIDEFDKMGSEHPALLEAMEQQSVSVAKAGIVCNLLSRTAIIAAANPCGGHYDRSKTVHENLRMGSAILSRFDIVFILLDKPDTERDEMLSDHVMALHSGKAVKKIRTETGSSQSSHEHSLFGKALSSHASLDNPSQQELLERLRIPGHEEFSPIPTALLRKYIGYARKYVHPRLSEEAKVVLGDFYLSLRRNHHSMDSTPITTRQLESLIRLAEARAKVELREIVTRDDALDVVNIMKESLIDTLSDDMGHVDFKRSTGMSKRKLMMTFVGKYDSRPFKTYERLIVSLKVDF